MAKSKNKIKSELGLLIVLVILGVSLFISTKLVQNNQENRSQAAVTGKSDKGCTNLKGTCILSTSTKNVGSVCKTTDNKTGTIKSRLCLSNSLPNYQCCVPDGKCANKYVNSNAACLQGIKNDNPPDLYMKTDGTNGNINNGQRIEYRWSCGTNNKCVQKIKINGSCGSAVNQCKSGRYLNITDSTTRTLWVCKGINGGSDSSTCYKAKPTTTSAPKTVSKTSVGNYSYNKILGQSDAQIIRNLDNFLTGKFSKTGSIWVYYAKGSNNGTGKTFDRDPYLLAAISMYETQGGYSCWAENYCNPGGITNSGGYKKYTSKELAIKDFFYIAGDNAHYQIFSLKNNPSGSYPYYSSDQIKKINGMHVNGNSNSGNLGAWTSNVLNYYNRMRNGRTYGFSPPKSGYCFPGGGKQSKINSKCN